MGERTSYTPGTFCWADLTTRDQETAKAFYSALFGWESEDIPIGDNVHYSVQRLDGLEVAAIAPQPQAQRDAGAPPAWNSYVAVERADAAVDRARELGANVHAGVMDVFDAGRMGVVQDPQGAYFAVWEARARLGARLVNQPGALTWNELYSPDLEASGRFYGGLFGWTTRPMEGNPMPYQTIQNAAGHGNGGMTTMPGVPPMWLVYFGTEDMERSLAQMTELGGTTMSGPLDIGVGTIAVAADPQGARFALFAGHMED